jgi:hypothetical protein
MEKRIEKWFVPGVAIVLSAIGAVDLWIAVVGGRVLDIPDPFLWLTYRKIIFLVGGLELVLSAFLLMASKRYESLKLSLIVSFAASFLLYRFGSSSVGGPDFFCCLGNLTDTLLISPATLDWLMVAIFIWLFLGAFGLLIYRWLADRRISRAPRTLTERGNEEQLPEHC